MKTIIKVLIAVAITTASMTSCFNDDWDLDKIDTDNIVVADTVAAPLGNILMRAAYLVSGIGEINVPIDVVIVKTESYDMDLSLEDFLTESLSADGKFYILTTIENNTGIAFDAETSFLHETDPSKSVPMPSYEVEARSTESFEFEVTFDEFKNMVEAEKLEVTVRSLIEAGTTITISEGDYIKANLALRKTGGIKL